MRLAEGAEHFWMAAGAAVEAAGAAAMAGVAARGGAGADAAAVGAAADWAAVLAGRSHCGGRADRLRARAITVMGSRTMWSQK